MHDDGGWKHSAQYVWRFIAENPSKRSDCKYEGSHYSDGFQDTSELWALTGIEHVVALICSWLNPFMVIIFVE